MTDYFALFGEARRPWIDPAKLKEKYFQLSRAAPPDAEDVKNPRRDTVVVLPPENGEMLDLSTNWMLLQNLAAQSRGAVYTPENVHELIERFAREVLPVLRDL